MNINSSSSYSVSGSVSSQNQITGLASGVNTDEMVEQMLSGTKKKIEKQQGLQQQTEWKQEIYRDVIQTINNFSGQYLDNSYGATTKNNLTNAGFFNTMISKVNKGSAVKVVSTSTSAQEGNTSVIVKQLAQTSKVTTDGRVNGTDPSITGKEITADMLAAFEKTVAFKVNNTSVKVNLNGISNQEEMLSKINAAFQDSGVGNKVKAEVYEGRMRFITTGADNTITVDDSNSTLYGLQMTGLDDEKTAGKSSTTTDVVTDKDGNPTGNTMRGTGSVDVNAGTKITLSLDGIEKEILIDPKMFGGTATNVTLLNALQESVKDAFGDNVKVGYKQDSNGNNTSQLEFKMNFADTTGHELRIMGSDATKIGIVPGTSTALDTGSTLSEITGIMGDRFSFTINGKDFTFRGDQKISTVMNTINKSGAGVTMSYSSFTDKFTLESTSSGEKYNLDVKQTEGNLLTTLFGNQFDAAETASKIMTTTSLTGNGVGLESDYTAVTTSLSMKVNGVNHIFSMAKRTGSLFGKEVTIPYTAEEIETAFNKWLKESFGEDSSSTQNISYKKGKLSINDGSIVEFSATSVDPTDGKAIEEAKKTDLALALGFNTQAKSNLADENTKIKDVAQLKVLVDYGTLNGESTLKSLSGGKLLQDVGKDASGNWVNATITYRNGVLELSSDERGPIDMGHVALSEMFGSKVDLGNDGKFDNDPATNTNYVKGQDAEIIVNGLSTSRTSNTFTINGITMTATAESAVTGTNAAGDPIYEETTIGTDRDADTIIEGIKSFVNDYNAMIKQITDLLDAKATYRDYEPLTTEQEDKMTETQIEKWEKKAKEGLLRNDHDMTSFVSSARAILYTKPESSELALYDIGIETGTWKKSGQLVFDESKFRETLASDPDSVRNLFTDATNGIGKLLKQACDDTAKDSYGLPGALVYLAGIDGSSYDTSSTLSTQITDIKTKIKDLQVKYEQERQKYWKQFTAMEKAMNNFNSQSGYLSSMFSTGG